MELETINCTPPELRAAAQEATNKLLPEKSKEIYEKEYQAFNTWCSAKGVKIISENVLLAYFEGQSKTKKSSTLWASYSMLRTCLTAYRNTDISKFLKLKAFLKRQSQGYKPKKSNILNDEEIQRFLNEADDLHFLAMKVILIMGYSGALRRQELVNLTTNDLKFKDDSIIVSIPKTKTNVPRLFVITEINWIQLIKKYFDLRPAGATVRFFLTYRNGHCIKNPIGINTISKIPKMIATFLKLPEPGRYTGHCFRRSSASHLANSGGDLLTIKRHGGWKSSSVVEGYIDTSMTKKVEVADMFRCPSPQPSTSFSAMSSASASIASTLQNESNQNPINIEGNNKYEQNILSQYVPGISINAKDSCSVTIKVYNNCTFPSTMDNN